MPVFALEPLDLLLLCVLGTALLAFFSYRAQMRRIERAAALSLADPLTGLKNRRFLDQTMSSDLALARRMRTRSSRRERDQVSATDFTVFMIDIDHFKVVNDMAGHFVGDAVLAETAQALRRACRESDIVVRWGGEEFVVVARFADRADAPFTAERLRAELASQEMVFPGVSPIRVTCSVGYASLPFDERAPERLSWQDVVRLADLAMYQSKRNGRNRVTGFVAGSAPLFSRGDAWQGGDIEALIAAGAIALDTPVPRLADRLAIVERKPSIHVA